MYDFHICVMKMCKCAYFALPISNEKTTNLKMEAIMAKLISPTSVPVKRFCPRELLYYIHKWLGCGKKKKITDRGSK